MAKGRPKGTPNKKSPEEIKAIEREEFEKRLAIKQLFYRDCGHEFRVWTRQMADYGQFEVMDKADFEKFKVVYQRFHGECSVMELSWSDRYEPGDNLDGSGPKAKD